MSLIFIFCLNYFLVFWKGYFFLLIGFGRFYAVNLDHFMNFHQNHYVLLSYGEEGLFTEEQVDRDKGMDKDMNKAGDTSVAAEYT